MRVCACVCVCARARVRACVHACVRKDKKTNRMPSCQMGHKTQRCQDSDDGPKLDQWCVRLLHHLPGLPCLCVCHQTAGSVSICLPATCQATASKHPSTEPASTLCIAAIMIRVVAVLMMSMDNSALSAPTASRPLPFSTWKP